MKPRSYRDLLKTDGARAVDCSRRARWKRWLDEVEPEMASDSDGKRRVPVLKDEPIVALDAGFATVPVFVTPVRPRDIARAARRSIGGRPTRNPERFGRLDRQVEQRAGVHHDR